MKLTLKEFIDQLACWYKKYTESPNFAQYQNLETGLSQKASDVGYLEKSDLLWIAIWGSPQGALRSLILIMFVGPACGSKALRCIYPQEYGAFDIHVRKACTDFLPTMDDREAEITGYLGFLAICHRLRGQMTVPGPRPKGLWYVADVEMGIFQFAYEGGFFKDLAR